MIEQGNIFTRKLSYYLEYNYKNDYCLEITFKTDDDKFLENVIEYIQICKSAHDFLVEKKERELCSIGYSTEYRTIVFSSENKEVATEIIRYIKNYIYSYQQKENEERKYKAFEKTRRV